MLKVVLQRTALKGCDSFEPWPNAPHPPKYVTGQTVRRSSLKRHRAKHCRACCECASFCVLAVVDRVYPTGCCLFTKRVFIVRES